jgi:uncharacterized membrane protein YfcA
MMVLICLVAFVASMLTLLSGFGLGTLLTPVFALFFSVEIAVAATALVHLANNVFKLALVHRATDWPVALRFGIPAAASAFVGAAALVYLAALPPLASYRMAGDAHSVTLVKLVVGTLIVLFAAIELSPRAQTISVPARYLPWGGALSGFFGGLSGNQGAFRSAFLLRAGLTKDGFVATGVVCAVVVDCARLAVYGASQLTAHYRALPPDVAFLVVAASLSAFAGAAVGARLLQALTLHAVRLVVAAMMIGVGLALGAGLI